jgi:hypothetical protein
MISQINMEKKIKKHEQILLELKRRKKMNDRYCDLNSCSPTPYMDGSNKILDEMIEYIEKLK